MVTAPGVLLVVHQKNNSRSIDELVAQDSSTAGYWVQEMTTCRRQIAGRAEGDEAPRRARFHWGWEAVAIGKCWAGTLKSILLDSALSRVRVHLKASAVICQPSTEGQELLHQGAERPALAS